MARWVDIHRALKVVTQPTAEPLSLTEAKLHLRVDHSDEDALIAALISAARLKVEEDTNRSLVSTTWDLTFDTFPDEERVIELPRSPLQSVTSIKSTDADGVETTFASTNYVIDTQSEPGRVLLVESAVWPSSLRTHNSGVIRFIAGSGPYAGAAVNVSTLTRVEQTATVTTPIVHNLQTGQQIWIAGATPSDYNGLKEIVVLGPMVFSFTVASGLTTPATGTITATPLGVSWRNLAALKLLLAFYYEHRGDDPRDIGEYPVAYHALLDRVWMLG